VSSATLISPRVRHTVMVIIVFGITGPIAVLLSRLLIGGLLGMEGSLWAGPWSFRLVYLLLIPPSYSMTLVVVGTIFGKREFFQARVVKMWGRLLPMRWIVSTPRPEGAETRRDR
jgi:hypothetical protein